MADRTGLPADSKQTRTDSNRHSQNSIINRRSYLKLTGAAIATGAMATGGAAAASVETVHVDPDDGRKVVPVGDNDTLQNKIYDVSEPGADIRIVAKGSGWKIRNIGIKGQISGGPHPTNQKYVISPNVSAGGHGLIENVYLGDGSTAHKDHIGIFVAKPHAGTVTIRDCFFKNWPNNGVYGAAPGRSAPTDGGGGGGEVHIENCYARNCNLDGFRVGTDGSYVTDSVVHVDKRVSYAYNDPGARNARGVWVKEGGDCKITNCDILLEHPSASYCIVEGDHEETGIARVSNSRLAARNGAQGLYSGNVTHNNIKGNPDVSVPDGVPTSPSQAANGGSKGGGSGGSHFLKIQGSGTGSNYSFTVENNLQKSSANGASIDSDATITNDHRSANGYVGSGADAYTFDGKLLSFDLDGDGVSITLDGESAHAGQLPDKCLQIQSQGGHTDYQLTASGGDLKKSKVGNATTYSSDKIINDGLNADGAVGGGGEDAYKFDGDLTSFNFNGGSINVLLNGQGAHVGQRPDHFLQIIGSGPHSDYSFTVGSNLKKSAVGDATVSDSDHVNGNSASGAVAGGTDAYTFDGDLRAFDLDGSGVNVLLDGQSAHVGDLPDHV